MVTITLAFFLAMGTFSTLAHFNPAIAERFNSTVKNFGIATVSSIAADTASIALSTMNLTSSKTKQKLVRVEAELKKVKTRNVTMLNTLKIQKSVLDQQDARIIKQSIRASNLDARYRNVSSELNKTYTKLNNFIDSGKRIESNLSRRFNKIALYDTTGAILGFIPIAGDITSLGFTAKGIYEMCQMFKEIEIATTELGVPYKVYSDTFCEEPAKRSFKLLTDAATDTRGYLGDRVFSTQQYWLQYFSK